mmetsp:Transcript_110665/g.191439  ORF Transcript_110665/g.191439 Transcript_110665/m.191439 type:complete len:95 (+) Transcript_110665:547-831(+)
MTALVTTLRFHAKAVKCAISPLALALSTITIRISGIAKRVATSPLARFSNPLTAKQSMCRAKQACQKNRAHFRKQIQGLNRLFSLSSLSVGRFS